MLNTFLGDQINMRINLVLRKPDAGVLRPQCLKVFRILWGPVVQMRSNADYDLRRVVRALGQHLRQKFTLQTAVVNDDRELGLGWPTS